MAIDESEIAAAQGQVKLLEMLGDPVPDAIRKLAELKPGVSIVHEGPGLDGYGFLGAAGPTPEPEVTSSIDRGEVIDAISRRTGVQPEAAAEVIDGLVEVAEEKLGHDEIRWEFIRDDSQHFDSIAVPHLPAELLEGRVVIKPLVPEHASVPGVVFPGGAREGQIVAVGSGSLPLALTAGNVVIYSTLRGEPEVRIGEGLVVLPAADVIALVENPDEQTARDQPLP